MRIALPILLSGAALAGLSCKVGPNYSTPPAKVASQWTQSPGSAGQVQESADSYGWHCLNDPVLDELVLAAHRNNLSLQAAGVRVLEARAQLSKSIGNLFPQQQALSASVNYARLNDGLTSTIPGVNPDYASDRVFFGASWELDFWGKFRRGIESDRAAYLGSFAAYEDALVTLTADVAATYVSIRMSEELIRVARDNVEIQKESLRIASAQFKAGETSQRDVEQATTQLAQTEAQIPRLEESLAQSRNALAVLLGETLEELQPRLAGSRNIPVAPAQIATGIPHDLLRRRPDVRAAGFAAASKSALIGVARAMMYPSFSLSGEFGLTGNNQGDSSLVDMFTWQGRALKAGAGFVFPILNYGRLLNQVRVQDAQFQEAVLNYQNTVLLAQEEVENGLATFTNERRAVASLTRAAEAARRSTALAVIQYRGGQADYTTVLTAQQAQLAVEDSLVTAQGNVVLGLVAVYRALGGGWEMREGGDLVSEQVKAGMARRTDWGKLLEPSQHVPRHISN